MDAKIIAKLLKTLPTCEHNIELTRPENENVYLNYGWANSIADYIEQQEKYAELGRLVMNAIDRCEQPETCQNQMCIFRKVCQLRDKLRTEGVKQC